MIIIALAFCTLALLLMFSFGKDRPRRRAAGEGSRTRRRALQEPAAPRSPQQVCDQFARELQANVIVVERPGRQPAVVAGAPWKPDLQLLDQIAINWCFDTGLPSGSGSKRSAGSDWLFVPVMKGRKVAAVFGITGRHCRRRIVPDEEPRLEMITSALRQTA